MEERKSIKVAAAVIIKDGLLYACQRGYGDWKDWWEFPGGKLEPGEEPEEALRREIREELDTEISVDQFLIEVEYDYPKFHMTMRCYLCSVIKGKLELKEHESAAWLRPDQFDSVRWLPADDEVLEAIRKII